MIQHAIAPGAAIRPFRIDVPKAKLDDLHARLAATHWPDDAPDPAWGMGTSRAYLQDLIHAWRTGDDWPRHEAALNELPQFMADVDGAAVHFVHVRGKEPNARPIVLTHGWPGTFHGFHKVVPMLTDPQRFGGRAEDAFDVVVPSISGFGFSERRAMSSGAVADLWARLMTELGYESFAAAGGDIGRGVTLALSRRHPDRVTGIHLTDVGSPTGQEQGLSDESRRLPGSSKPGGSARVPTPWSR